jgi:hypothetical protein
LSKIEVHSFSILLCYVSTTVSIRLIVKINRSIQHKMSQQTSGSADEENNEEAELNLNQDKAILLWFVNDGGTTRSLSSYLHNQRITFPILSKLKKRQVQNRVTNVARRIWNPDHLEPFVSLLRLRGFTSLALKVEQGETVPKYILNLQQRRNDSTSRSIVSSSSTHATPPASPAPSPVASFQPRQEELLTTPRINSSRADFVSPFLSPARNSRIGRSISFESQQEATTNMDHLLATQQPNRGTGTSKFAN